MVALNRGSNLKRNPLNRRWLRSGFTTGAEYETENWESGTETRFQLSPVSCFPLLTSTPWDLRTSC